MIVTTQSDKMTVRVNTVLSVFDEMPAGRHGAPAKGREFTDLPVGRGETRQNGKLRRGADRRRGTEPATGPVRRNHYLERGLARGKATARRHATERGGHELVDRLLTAVVVLVNAVMLGGVDFVGESGVELGLGEVGGGGHVVVDRRGGVAQGAAQLRDVVTVTCKKKIMLLICNIIIVIIIIIIMCIKKYPCKRNK